MQSNVYIHIHLLFLPLILANIIHMIMVKKNILANWAIPISTHWFGINKTWRGFIILPFITAILTGTFNHLFLDNKLSTPLALFLGMGLGFSYILWELPNSFIKRRLGIANGERSKKMPLLQVFTDKADSLIGVFLFYFLVLPIGVNDILILFTASIVIHLIFSYVLFVLGIKKSV